MHDSNTYAARRRREAEHHDKWAEQIDPAATIVDETFTAITAVENQFIVEQFGDVRGKRLLDLGCGAAEGGVYFAKLGADVVGIDVSSGMLDAAQELAAHHGVTIETRLVDGDGIGADTGEFDLVYGNGVLHHLDLDAAQPEIARILKPTGMGCFIEPLSYNPVIGVYRRMANTMRTEDESPLSFGDIKRFENLFGSVSHREFWLLTLSIFLRFYLLDRVAPSEERYWKKIYTDAQRLAPMFGPLRRMDDVILKLAPPLRRLCWNTVITLEQPTR